MAFVNELIPESEKEKFSFLVTKERDGTKPTLWRWTIDRARDIYLVQTGKEGGPYEGTECTRHFALNLAGTVVLFSGESKVGGDSAQGVVVDWRIHDIRMHEAEGERPRDVHEPITEALSAMGLLYDTTYLKSVNVEFDAAASA